MRTFALVMLLVALPRLSYAEDAGVSHALLDKIACKMPFSVAATYLDLRAAKRMGMQEVAEFALTTSPTSSWPTKDNSIIGVQLRHSCRRS